MRAACAQVWLVLTSVRALRTLGRATAACRGGGEAQEAACGGGKVAIPAILTRLPDPGHAVRLQDCKIATFGRALHRPDQVQAAWRAAARHWYHLVSRSSYRVKLLLQLPKRVPAPSFSTGLALSSVDSQRRQGTQGTR